MQKIDHRNGTPKVFAADVHERQIIANLPVSVFIKDRQLTYVYGNRPFFSLLGRNGAEVLGRSDSQLFPAELASDFRRQDELVMTRKTPQIFINRYDAGFGARWARTTKTPYFDQDGNVVGVLGFVEDATPEYELGNRLDRLGEIVEAATDVVATVSLAFEITYLNPAGRRCFGLGTDEPLLRKSFVDLFPSRAVPHIVSTAFPTAIREGRWIGETTIKAVNGTEFTASQTLIAHRSADNSIQFFSTIIRDTSDLTKARRELEAKTQAIDTAVTGMAICDHAGKLIYVNHAFCELWQVLAPEDVLGRSTIELWVDPAQAVEVILHIQRKDYWQGEMAAKRRDGAEFTAWVSASVARDSENNVLNMLATFIDITDARKREEELRISENRYCQVIRNSRTVAWEIDPEGRFTYLSDNVEVVVGYRPHELVSSAFFYDLQTAANREEFRSTVFEIMRRRTPFRDLENPIRRKDGTVIWVVSNGTPIIGPNNELTGYYGSVRDITENKAIRDQLAYRESLLRETERISGTGSWEEDHRTGTVRWSDELFRILEIDPKLRPPSSAAFMERIHPDDLRQLEELYRTSLEGSDPFEATFRLQFPDARVRYVEARAHHYRDSVGPPHRSVGFLRDVTELTSVRAELEGVQRAMDRSTTSLTIMNPDGALTYANASFLRAVGATSIDQVIGRSCTDFFADVAAARRGQKELSTRGSIARRSRLRRMDGSVVQMMYVGYVIRSASGENVGAVGTFLLEGH